MVPDLLCTGLRLQGKQQETRKCPLGLWEGQQRLRVPEEPEGSASLILPLTQLFHTALSCPITEEGPAG